MKKPHPKHQESNENLENNIDHADTSTPRHS